MAHQRAWRSRYQPCIAPPVADLVGPRLANTALLAAAALRRCAARDRSRPDIGPASDGIVDRSISLVSLMLIAVPDYLVAGLLVLLLAVTGSSFLQSATRRRMRLCPTAAR
jgi:ABC-type dipeptide/oligopeptide/nickel transport system permease component